MTLAIISYPPALMRTRNHRWAVWHSRPLNVDVAERTTVQQLEVHPERYRLTPETHAPKRELRELHISDRGSHGEAPNKRTGRSIRSLPRFPRSTFGPSNPHRVPTTTPTLVQ